ncbi:hypothetical protein NKH18_09865 [Streptomyces sp. M10(2022)]
MTGVTPCPPTLPTIVRSASRVAGTAVTRAASEVVVTTGPVRLDVTTTAVLAVTTAGPRAVAPVVGSAGTTVGPRAVAPVVGSVVMTLVVVMTVRPVVTTIVVVAAPAVSVVMTVVRRVVRTTVVGVPVVGSSGVTTGRAAPP